MSRRRAAKKREVTPDLKYGSVDVTKLIKYVMRQGRIDVARNIVYSALEQVEKKLSKDPVEILAQGIENARPLAQVKSRRVGGATYPVPMAVSLNRSKAFALKWMVEAVNERALKDATLDLTQVLIDSSNKTGYAVNKKNEMHRQAEANQAFAHYKW